MAKFRDLFLLALATASLNLFAADSGGLTQSEALRQTEEGRFEITPGIGAPPSLNGSPGYWTINGKSRVGALKVKSTILPFDVGAEFGLSQMFSVGVALEYVSSRTTVSGCTSGEVCPTFTDKGLANPEVLIKGRLATGPGLLHYGLNIGVGLGKHKTNASNDSNVSTDQNSITPNVAYQLPVGTGVIGLQLMYAFYLNDASSSQDTPSGTSNKKTKGGNPTALEVFYEVPLSGFSLGGLVRYASFSNSKSSVNGGPTTSDSNAQSNVFVDLYAPITFTSFMLIPSLGYQSVNYTDGLSDYSYFSGISVGASARFNF